MQTFSKRLKALRQERGISQEALGNVICKERTTVSGYEATGKEPNLETLCAIAKYFGVSSDYLIGLSDERTYPQEEVFPNDKGDFAKAYKAAPTDLRRTIAQCFSGLYSLLHRDILQSRSEQVSLSQKLICTISKYRTQISKSIETSGGTIADPAALSDLMAAQSQLKSEVSSLLDKLMQADIEAAFNTKNRTKAEQSKASGM